MMRSVVTITLLGAVCISSAVSAQSGSTRLWRAPSARFAAAVGCDSAAVAATHRRVLADHRTAAAADTTRLYSSCDLLAWYGPPDSFTMTTSRGAIEQETWQYDGLTSPLPALVPTEPPGPWHLLTGVPAGAPRRDSSAPDPHS